MMWTNVLCGDGGHEDSLHFERGNNVYIIAQHDELAAFHFSLSKDPAVEDKEMDNCQEATLRGNDDRP